MLGATETLGFGYEIFIIKDSYYSDGITEHGCEGEVFMEELKVLEYIIVLFSFLAEAKIP